MRIAHAKLFVLACVLAVAVSQASLTAEAAEVGNIEVCYYCGVGSEAANFFQGVQDGPIFKINNFTSAPLTNIEFAANGDTYHVGTIAALGNVILLPGVSNDGGTHASGAFWFVTGSLRDTSEEGPNSNSTPFVLNAVAGGESATTGTFTPATSVQAKSNDGTVTNIDFLGGPGDNDRPCDNCYGPDVVATINTAATPPAPTITSLQPNSLDAGSAAFTLTVTGSNFVSGDTVDWNGIQLTTTYVSSAKLTAKVPATDVAAAGSAAVTVVDTAADGVASAPALFAIPLTSIVIGSQTIKSASSEYSITLTLENTGFHTAKDIALTGAYLATTETSTTLPIDIASLAPSGVKAVTLSFPSSVGKAGVKRFLSLYGSYIGGGISLTSLETLP